MKYRYKRSKSKIRLFIQFTNRPFVFASVKTSAGRLASGLKLEFKYKEDIELLQCDRSRTDMPYVGYCVRHSWDNINGEKSRQLFTLLITFYPITVFCPL